MKYVESYNSPLGKILLAADDEGLTGLWFIGQKYFASGLQKEHEQRSTPWLEMTSAWLDIYFSGKEPNFMPKLHPLGTPFQLEVWANLCEIPYGRTTTYGKIAKQIAHKHGNEHMSAQTVGNAVGRNRISIIIPCHRVVGSNGSLTGYAGRIERKMALLDLENALSGKLSIPK